MRGETWQRLQNLRSTVDFLLNFGVFASFFGCIIRPLNLLCLLPPTLFTSSLCVNTGIILPVSTSPYQTGVRSRYWLPVVPSVRPWRGPPQLWTQTAQTRPDLLFTRPAPLLFFSADSATSVPRRTVPRSRADVPKRPPAEEEPSGGRFKSPVGPAGTREASPD